MNIVSLSMRLKPTYKIVTWLTFTLFTPLAVLSFNGQVLCVGDDNHMQVESTIDTCCNFGVSDSGDAELRGEFSEHSDCGDCSDLHLDQVRSMRVRSRSAISRTLSPSAGPVWSLAATPPASRDTKRVRWDEYSPALTQPQLSISTAILIC